MANHLCLFPSWYPEKEGDVGGSFFREQAIALSRHGHQVGVVYANIFSFKKFKNYLKAPKGTLIFNDEGVETYIKNDLCFLPKVPNAYSWFCLNTGMKLFERYIEENGKPDVIHVHSILHGGVLAKAVKEKYGIPYVITEHSTHYARKLLNDKQLELAQGVVNQANSCIAVSEPFAQVLSDIFDSNTNWLTIPNILSSRFEQVSDLSLTQKKIFTFCNASLLTDIKGIDILLRAFTSAFKGRKHIQLKIGGDGPSKVKLIALSKELGIEQQVKFLGRLSRAEVVDMILESNAYALSSHVETFGVSIIESLALGRPVVATRCGGPESIVQPSDGYLVEKDNAQALSDALIEMYDNYEKFEPSDIRKSCLNRYSESAVIELLSKVYAKVIGC
jgi:glycosyltransferase involved in cell wall biosynthesis